MGGVSFSLMGITEGRKRHEGGTPKAKPAQQVVRGGSSVCSPRQGFSELMPMQVLMIERGACGRGAKGHKGNVPEECCVCYVMSYENFQARHECVLVRAIRL